MKRTSLLANEKTFLETQTALLVGLILPVLVLALPGCSQEDYSTPRSTVETAREALRADDADRLYRSFSKKGRSILVKRMRSKMDALPAEVFEEAGFDRKDPNDLSDRDVFALALRMLRSGRRTNELLKLYANSEVTIRRESDTHSVVTIKSRFPIPYERGSLRRIDGEWKIHGME